MPFYSDPGYYYGGGYQLYSPYYTPSTLYSPYNSYSRSLGGTYVVPSSRVNLSSSRYKPKLSTISETPISCRNSGLIPLTRIQSPKVSYHSSPYFKPPRPIPINTSDIDVSSAKYKRHEQRDHNDSDHSNIEPPIKPEKLDNNNNNVDQNFPSNNAEQDEGNTSKRHCSTIKRNRAVVRLSIIRRRSSEEKRKNEEIEHRTIVNSTQKPIIVDDQEKGENISWRDRFRDDLVPQQREVQRKSPGDRLREKYLIPDKQKDEGRDIYDDDDENGTVPVDLTKSLVFNQNNAEDKLTLNVEETLRRLSLPKLPSFHDICQDISSDKIDDDLNAGSLRRRASIIQEQEAEIINQLQKSGSGTFQYILERVESQEDCRQSTNRKSKKVKKIRHKITATVQIDNPKLERIIPELPEDSQNKVTSVEPKLKAKIETIEEDQTIHKIFKLPKKKLKATSNSEQSKKDKTLDNNEQEICLKCVSIEKQPVSPTGPLVFMEPIATPNSLLSPEGSPKKQSMATSASSRALTPLKNHIEEPQHFTFEMVSAKSKPAYIKSAMTIESPISPKTLQKIEETRYTHPSSKGTLSGNERLEENDSKTSTVQKVTKPSKISDDSLKISLSEPQIIKSEAIMKLQKSDNEEDFWATIDSRESLYMANRKSNLLKQQAATKTDMTENTEVTDLKESQQFEKPKAKSHSQNTKIPKETNVNKKMSREEVLGGMCEAIKVTVLSETVKTTDHSKTEHGPKYASISTGAVPAIGTSAGEDDNRIAFKGKEDAQSKCDDGLRKVSHLADSQKHSAKAAPSQAEAIQEIQSTRNSSPQDISSQKDAKINTGLKLKSAEIHTGKLTGRDTRDTEMPLTENDAFTTKKASSPGKKARKSITLNSEIVATHELLTIAKGDDSSIKEADANPSESKESGRREESGDSVVKQQSNTDHQQNDKIRKKKTGSPHKGTEKQSGPEKLAKKPSPKKQGPPLADRAVPPVQGDVKSGASNQQTEIISTRADCKSKNFDTCDIFGGDINDAITPNRIAKDEFESIETAECKLSKFPTVSNLNRCLQDVDAELDDYYPSEEKSSYDSSEDEDEDGDSMKKKNRDKKKEDKFDPNKVIKLDHKKKCYVKEEAPPYPLIATPRPLWKREKFQYLNDSNSESEESESDSECTVSEESCDELNPNKDSIIRMSTCSNDSGFEGGTAPSSPRKMLETSYTFAQFQKSGRITAPATIIPRFKKYSVEDFHFLAVLGKGSFGKVLLAELRNTEYYYAVKCLKKDVVLEDDDVECTLIERKVLALGTKHPYLCHLFCTFQTESHLFFVMEYLNGGDLMFHIQQTGRFSEPRAKFYAAEIISGLKFLHKKGIIYRDLKLDNVLLDFDGHVRIADFGMCKLQIYLDKTADSFCGTPDYMAPEIIKGEKYNQNVDWWSFGVLLYEMLIGQSPFSGCDEDELFWSICNEIPWFPIYVSQEAVDILKGLLEKDSSKRIGSQYSLAGEICGHSFFSDIDWGRLDRRELEPPFKPQVKHPLDTQYFDKAFTRERVRLTPIDKEILQSMDQEQFQGFSYTNPNATLN